MTLDIAQLEVFRVNSVGQECKVGRLAQANQHVYFQYDQHYLQHGHSLSPFRLKFLSELQPSLDKAQALHGVFADSLPDGWGRLLMDRWLRQQGYVPQHIGLMQRLALVGEKGVGALRYRPNYDIADNELLDLFQLGQQAQAIFEGHSEQVLAQLVHVASSGGARPKALVYLNPDNQHMISQPQQGYQPWLVKFTSNNLALGHDEGRCEAAYLTMAAQVGISVPEWRLYQHKQQAWLMLKRFDAPSDLGRWHMHSAAGLLDANFREPSLDYEDLIKVTAKLCQSMAAAKQQLLRALFNSYALNMDDHSKNWAFLQHDDGQWHISPMFDVTFSPNSYGEHMTAFAGYGKKPPQKAIMRLAQHAGITQWSDLQAMIDNIKTVLATWPQISKELGVSDSYRQMIAKSLDASLKK
ncbi:MAG: type II toxin-antitoxin system HipA family toxin [Agitococcus sp.]|jgi:serine/threonine-protein kinase HipA|nr:type II toxin-antitoxin system HipA family toxin [Agitococcus sp.]